MWKLDFRKVSKYRKMSNTTFIIRLWYKPNATCDYAVLSRQEHVIFYVALK